MTLGGGAGPSALQFDLSYPAAAVDYETSSLGPAASSQSKSISCSGSGGTTTCVIFGLNNNSMSNGVVATIGFRIQPATSATSAAIGLPPASLSASNPAGTAINITGSGGTITINQPQPVNQAPTANGASVSTNEDTALPITLSASDPDGNPLTYQIVSQPSKGSLTGSGASRTYTPNANVNGSDSFTFRVNDGALNSNTATVNITINPVNDAPTAQNQSVSTAQNTAKGITLSGSDVEGSPLTYSIVSGPSNGSVSGGTGPSRTYTPANGYSGPDSFTFRVNDGALNSNIATVSITVTTTANNPPTATGASVTTNEDTALPITLNASDPDGNSLTYSIMSQPSKGSLTGSGASRTYTPNANANGPDSFTFRVSDGTVNSNTATINITITPVNDAPVAENQSVSTPKNKALSIKVAGTDVDGDTLTYAVLGGASNGVVSGTPPNLTYTPNNNYVGNDSFRFRVNDNRGGTADGTVSINVTGGANAPPGAGNQKVKTPKNKATSITLTGTDPDGDTLTFSITSAPAKGALNGNPPNVTYTPNNGYVGLDSFRFQVRDSQGATATGTVDIEVTETAENKPPTATDASVTTNANTSKAITLKGTDPDGDALNFSVVTGPLHGVLHGTAPNLIYVPNNAYQGNDSFTFQVNDNKGGTDLGTISISILEGESNSVSLSSLTCSGNTLTGGGSRTCQVVINQRAPAGGVRVRLTHQSKQLSVPASVQIVPNDTLGRFKVNSSLIEASETVQLTASLGNGVPQASPGQVALGNNTATTQLNLIPLQPTDLSCLPVQITAGKTFTCRARLNSSSFSEQVLLAVSSSSGDVKVPDSLSLRPGSSSAMFRASSRESAKQQSATVAVRLNGARASSSVSIVGVHGPTIHVETPQVISVGKKLTFEVTAQDPSDLPVTLSASDLPPGANFDPQSGRLTWTPAGVHVGTHLVTFKARNTADAVSQKVVTIDAILGTMKVYSFTNSASSRGDFPCSPGSLATVWGVGFTDGAGERARGFPLPTRLNGIRVDVSSRDARLLYVGARQINLQCPSLPPGEKLSITVERLDSGDTATWNAPGVSMREASPAIFSLDGSGTGQGLAIIANSSKVAMFPTPDFDGQAAEPGDHLVIYANGLGLVDHEVPAGEPAVSSPLSQVVATVRVRVGDVILPVTFAGLAPDTAGVYQVNAVLSETVPTGPEVPVSLEIQMPDGTMVQSNVVTIAIQEGAPRFAE